jgi:hypothetical protein
MDELRAFIVANTKHLETISENIEGTELDTKRILYEHYLSLYFELFPDYNTSDETGSKSLRIQ